MSAPGELVFVYGTLRQGASQHPRMEGAEFVTEAWVPGRLYPISWYPGLVLDGNGGPVRGEVYRVAPELLEKLDAFEGVTGTGAVTGEYARVKAEARQPAGPTLNAWVWEYQRDVRKLKEIVPADWLSPGRP